MPEDRNYSIVPAMVHAAAQFAALGLAGLIGAAIYNHDGVVVKLVILAAFVSYIAQLLLVWAEQAQQSNYGLPDRGAGQLRFYAMLVYACAVNLVLVSLVRALYFW